MPHLGFTVSAMAIYSSCLKLSARAQPFDQYIGLSTGFKYTCVIDQAWGQVFAFLWTKTKSRSVKAGKKEQGLYPAILTEQAWLIEDLL